MALLYNLKRSKMKQRKEKAATYCCEAAATVSATKLPKEKTR
jgi:hypothetical protein